MQDTVVIQLINPGALALLEELENLQIIKVIREEVAPVKSFEKYFGILTKEEGEDLKAHVKEMREEWNDI